MQLRSEHSIGIFHIRINWLFAVCVFVTAAAFARLGLWQLERAAEKVQAQQAMQIESSLNATPVEDLPAGHLHRANPEIQNQHVLLRGEFVNDRTILLLAEFFQGMIGYGVVTPFRLESNGQLVLVSRGWTTGILPPDTPPELRPVSGPVEVTAQIYVPPDNARVLSSQIDPSVWPLRMRTLEFDVITEILGEPLFPFEVRLTDDQPGVLVRHWPAVNADVNQNLSYAVQWFSFSLLVLFVSLLASSNLWALLKGSKP
ncbi:MAG: SURF1 family protein [Pseudohongiellaceae bacterium]